MMVATKMPSTIGHGFLNRAASTRARSCVLSPISASATTEVEMRKASMAGVFRPETPEQQLIDHAPAPAQKLLDRYVVNGLVQRVIDTRLMHHGLRPKFVDACLFARRRKRTTPQRQADCSASPGSWEPRLKPGDDKPVEGEKSKNTDRPRIRSIERN